MVVVSNQSVLDPSAVADVDSLKSIDVLVVFSSLSSWRGEGGSAVGLVRKPSLGFARSEVVDLAISLSLVSPSPWCLPPCSWLNGPTTPRTSTASNSSSVPDREEVGTLHNGENTGPAPSGSNTARHDEEGRHEHSGEMGMTVSNGGNDRVVCGGLESKEEYVIVLGVLVMKSYHWQGKYMGPPVLEICTTGSRTARLQLEAG